MKLRKLLHKPTGMFYTPSRGNGNLSKKGKIYIEIIPKIEWATTLRIKFNTERISKHNKIISNYFKLDLSEYSVDTYVKTNPEDWEIIEVI